MDSKSISTAIEQLLVERGCFLVGITVSEDNDIEVTIEKSEGSIDMEDCVAVNNKVLDTFDRDVEDYALTVTSAGLDQAFTVPGQFAKAVGSKVEVLVKGGRKLVCVLKAADAESITVTYSAKEAVEGKKKKVLVEKEETLAMTEVNSVKYHIEFE